MGGCWWLEVFCKFVEEEEGEVGREVVQRVGLVGVRQWAADRGQWVVVVVAVGAYSRTGEQQEPPQPGG